jgi:hypothetical protein
LISQGSESKAKQAKIDEFATHFDNTTPNKKTTNEQLTSGKDWYRKTPIATEHMRAPATQLFNSKSEYFDQK